MPQSLQQNLLIELSVKDIKPVFKANEKYILIQFKQNFNFEFICKKGYQKRGWFSFLTEI